MTAPGNEVSLRSKGMEALDGAQLQPITLAFASRRLEAQYWKQYLPKLRGQSVVAVGTVLVLYSVFAFLDPWIVPEAVREIGTIRGSVSLLCALLIIATRTALFQRMHQLILAIVPIVGGFGILMMLAIAGSTGSQLYYAGLILAIIWTLLIADLRFVYALPICVAMVVGYEIIALILKPQPLPIVLNNTFFLLSALVMSAFAGYTIERYNRLSFQQSLLIDRERQRSERLLLNVLPREIAERLKHEEGTIADRHEQASILFADIVGFTPLSAQMSPEEMVELLNETYSCFDSLVEKYGLEKIRTVGDSYMVAAGVPRPRADHAQALAAMALEMRDHSNGSGEGAAKRLRFRIGINSGPVVAGVIGQTKFHYDVWGDTVNTASRMESHGVPGRIQIGRATYELLQEEFVCEPRGAITVKGLGEMETWFLVGVRPPSPRRRPLHCPPRSIAPALT